MEEKFAEFLITDQKDRFDLKAIHSFLTQSYWARGRDLKTVKATVENSYCVGLFMAGRQIGFARVITDYQTLGYLCDVFVLPEFQGQGLGKKMVRFALDSPELQQVKKFMLATKDAHSFYRTLGFEALKNPAYYMEKHR